jgi:hypothetical protein
MTADKITLGAGLCRGHSCNTTLSDETKPLFVKHNFADELELGASPDSEIGYASQAGSHKTSTNLLGIGNVGLQTLGYFLQGYR